MIVFAQVTMDGCSMIVIVHYGSGVSVARILRVQDTLFMCFFFQAEDGIRDLTVTGVQTCALPISASLEDRTLDLLHPVDLALLVAGLLDVSLVDDEAGPQLEPLHRRLEPGDLLLLQIGRASCRGRV